MKGDAQIFVCQKKTDTTEAIVGATNSAVTQSLMKHAVAIC